MLAKRSWTVTWGLLGASWAQLGRSWAPLGLNLGPLGRLLGPTWRSWDALGRSWDSLWTPKNRKSWRKAGSKTDFLEKTPYASTWYPILPLRGSIWPSRGRFWTLRGSIFGPFFGQLVVQMLPQVCPKLVPSLSKVCPTLVLWLPTIGCCTRLFTPVSLRGGGHRGAV